MNPAQTIYQFFLGFAAAYLVIYSKSVVPGIIIHAVSNGLVILMEFWGGLSNVFNSWANVILRHTGWGILLSFVLMAAGIAIIVGSCLLINRFCNKEKVVNEIKNIKTDTAEIQDYPIKKKNKVFRTLIVAPLIVCALIWFVEFFTMRRDICDECNNSSYHCTYCCDYQGHCLDCCDDDNCVYCLPD